MKRGTYTLPAQQIMEDLPANEACWLSSDDPALYEQYPFIEIALPDGTYQYFQGALPKGHELAVIRVDGFFRKRMKLVKTQ